MEKKQELYRQEEAAVGVPYPYPAQGLPQQQNPYQAGMVPPNAVYGDPKGIPLHHTMYRDTPAPFDCVYCGSSGLTTVRKTVKSGAQTQRKDPAWKHGVQVEGERGYVYIKCNYCSKVIKGGVKRMKDHIGGTHKNVQPCTKAPDEAKTECLQYMKKYTSARQAAQEIFEEMAESGSYFGAPICVQVVTDNASAYKAAGRKLMEKRQHLYWTPCAAHCIDLMLESIGKLPQHKNALTKGKRVTNFIYNHQWVLSLMRKIAKKEIIRPGITRFATAFLTLHSIYRMKQSLEQVFTSTEWSESKWAKTNEGKEVRKIILKDRTFWSSVVYVMKTTSPLVSVLRMVDGEKEPAMGFIYGAMDKAKEQIAKNLGGELSAYKEIWDIIDERWDNQLHRDLHGAGYFLNPRFHYSDSFDECAEVKRGLYNCLERLIIDQDDQRKADFQIDAFRHKQGLFGRNLARTSYEHRSPDPSQV